MSTKIQISQVQGLESIALDYTGVSGNLATTGSTLSSNLSTTGQSLTYRVDDVSGNLITTGASLATDLSSISGDLGSTGATLTSNIDTVSSNLNQTGIDNRNYIDTASGEIDTRLGSTGSNLLSRDAVISGALRTSLNSTNTTLSGATSDISTLSGSLSSTNSTVGGHTLSINSITGDLSLQNVQISDASSNISTLQTGFTNVNSKADTISGDLLSTGLIVNDLSGNLETTGAKIDTVSGNLITTGSTLETFSNSVSGNLVSTGDTLSILAGNNNKSASQVGSLTFDTGSDTVLYREFAILGGIETKSKTLQWTKSFSGANDIKLGGSVGFVGEVPQNVTWNIDVKGIAQDTADQNNIYMLKTGFVVFRTGISGGAAVKVLEIDGSEHTNGAGSGFSITPYIAGYNVGFSGSANAYTRFHVVAKIEETQNYY